MRFHRTFACAALIGLLLAGGPAPSSAQESAPVYQRINLDTATRAVEAEGLAVEQVTQDQNPLHVISVTMEDGERVPILSMRFYNCAPAPDPSARECTILRFGSVNYLRNLKRSQEMVQKATQDRINEWNLRKTSSPLLVQQGTEGLYLRSDLEFRGGVAFDRIRLHLNEAIGHIDMSMEFLLQGSGELIAGLRKGGPQNSALATANGANDPYARLAAKLAEPGPKAFGAAEEGETLEEAKNE